jgi:phosphotriesterase-related protein
MSEQAFPSHEERVAARRPPLRYVPTVRGPVREDRLGVVLPHERILLDLRTAHEPYYPELAERPVELDMLGRLRRHPATCLDNLLLDDPELMLAELGDFRHAAAVYGGGTVVDLTCRGPRLSLTALVGLAERSELNIVVSTGLNHPRDYPAGLAAQTVDELAALFAADVEQGIDSTGIRAGIVGLIAIPEPQDPRQVVVLRAGARAAVRTGAPLAVACPPGEGFLRVHRLLLEERLPPTRVLLSGMDQLMDPDERRRPADLGYYLLFDGFGQEHYFRGGVSRTPRDPERIGPLKELVESGHLRQLLVSQGIDRKMFLRRYGGWGYAHILNNVLPMMQRERLAPKQITTILMYNPARALAFT